MLAIFPSLTGAGMVSFWLYCLDSLSWGAWVMLYCASARCWQDSKLVLVQNPRPAQLFWFGCGRLVFGHCNHGCSRRCAIMKKLERCIHERLPLAKRELRECAL